MRRLVIATIVAFGLVAAPASAACDAARPSDEQAWRGELRCIAGASQVQLTGQRMSTIGVSVDGRRLGTREIRLLQRRVLPLNRIFPPGRHRLTIRVTFEQGSATAPATLTRTITVCNRATQVPRVTG